MNLSSSYFYTRDKKMCAVCDKKMCAVFTGRLIDISFKSRQVFLSAKAHQRRQGRAYSFQTPRFRS